MEEKAQKDYTYTYKKITCPKCQSGTKRIRAEGHKTEEGEYISLELTKCVECEMEFYI